MTDQNSLVRPPPEEIAKIYDSARYKEIMSELASDAPSPLPIDLVRGMIKVDTTTDDLTLTYKEYPFVFPGALKGRRPVTEEEALKCIADNPAMVKLVEYFYNQILAWNESKRSLDEANAKVINLK
jgi:hypothetical protein